MKLKIGYAKLGRSFPVRYERSSSLGGDQAVIRLFDYLRRDHEVHIVGPNQGVTDALTYGYVPENTVNHWLPGEAFGEVPTVANSERRPDSPNYQHFLKELELGVKRLPKLDAWVVWLGQHSSVSSFLPPEIDLAKEHVTPLMSQINYVYPLLYMFNNLNVRPIWLHPDARNYLKCRDLRLLEQRTILSQYNRNHEIKSWHPTEGTRLSQLQYRYAGLELLVMPEHGYGLIDQLAVLSRTPPLPFGVLTNEGQDKKYNSRHDNVRDWCTPIQGYDGWELVGHFVPESQHSLGRKITPIPNTQVRETLRRWRATITFPPTADSHSSKWASAKPWECFAAGTVCFKHPLYDTQGHIYGDRMKPELREFLRVDTPKELLEKVRIIAEDDGRWRSVVGEQFAYVSSTMKEWNNGRYAIDRAIGEVAAEGTSGHHQGAGAAAA